MIGNNMSFINLFIFSLPFLICFNYQIQAADISIEKVSEVADPLKYEWFCAVNLGDLEAIQQLSSKIDINITDKLGRTALMHAAYDGKSEIVKFLLTVPGIDVNAQSSIVRNTALMDATIAKHTTIVDMLLEAPNIKINVQDIFGQTVDDKAQTVECAKAIQSKINELMRLAFEELSLYTHAKNEINRQQHFGELKNLIAQIGVDRICDTDGNTLVDKAFAANCYEIAEFLLINSENARELLARLPFEMVNPTSELFKLCMYLSGMEKSLDTHKIQVNDHDILNLCAECSAHNCTQICSGCKKIYYCSIECQKKHWQNHKLDCKLH